MLYVLEIIPAFVINLNEVFRVSLNCQCIVAIFKMNASLNSSYIPQYKETFSVQNLDVVKIPCKVVKQFQLLLLFKNISGQQLKKISRNE